jgi:hypothetical protein
MKLSDHNEPVWNCTYQYSVKPKIYTKNAIDSTNIRLKRNTEGYIEGFEILVNNTSVPNAEKERTKLGDCLEKILTIKSGMSINAWLSGFERKDTITGNSELGTTQRHDWDVEGGIDTLNLSDSSVQNILNSGTTPNLESLSNAVFHLPWGRYRESINRDFAIIENITSVADYWKFNCIRNVLTHEKLYQNVIDDFKKYFGPNVYAAFDFKKYDPHNGIINLDFESKKTRKTLFYVAMDLINECKRILGL